MIGLLFLILAFAQFAAVRQTQSKSPDASPANAPGPAAPSDVLIDNASLAGKGSSDEA